jgi:hypothetical protein
MGILKNGRTIKAQERNAAILPAVGQWRSTQPGDRLFAALLPSLCPKHSTIQMADATEEARNVL